MPTQLNENLSDQLVMSDAFQRGLGPGGLGPGTAITLTLSDQLVQLDAWQLLMINPSGSTQGAWSMEIGERLNMADRFTSPATRVSQVPIEVVMAPTDGKARLTQSPIEVVQTPTDGKARVTQVVIELVTVRPAGSFTGTVIQMRIQ